jgi:peptidoglycan/LPS O-acetylase OafA/YrhL
MSTTGAAVLPAAEAIPCAAVASRAEAPALPLPQQPRYQSLDFMRGIACVLVVVLHSTAVHEAFLQQPGNAPTESGVVEALFRGAQYLWLGVPMFFVISGYCIAATADSTRRRPRALTTYFLRRCRRIYPPYWAALALATALVIGLDVLLFPGLLSRNLDPMSRPWWLSWPQVLGNLSLTETWRHHLGGGDRGYLLGPAWTLCYEEQFYAATGLLLLVSARFFFRAATVLSALCLLTTFAARWLRIPIAGFFFDGHWLLFAAGILVYWQVNYAAARQRVAITVFLVLCVVFSWFGPPLMIDAGVTAEGRVKVAFVFALILSFLHPLDRWLCAQAWIRPVAFCGTICYSLYLTHRPVVGAISQAFHLLGVRDTPGTLFLTVPVCLAVALLVGWVFHLLVERRFLNPPQTLARPADKTQRPAAAANGVVAVT